MIKGFTEFKEKFYARVPDFTVFDCEEFNLLKVVLDGLKVNYLDRGMTKAPIFNSNFVAETTLFLKRIKYQKQLKEAQRTLQQIRKSGVLTKKNVIIDNGRLGLDGSGEKVSFYFNRVMETLGRNHVCLVEKVKVETEHDICLTNLSGLNYLPYSSADKKLIRSLKITYERIRRTIDFSEQELHNIRIAISNFFYEYRLWSQLLEQTDFRICYFITHYHKEGLLLAFKRKAVKMVEFQHGLIAREDVFYVFPEVIKNVRDKALFPDKIYTYGQYWNDVLSDGAEFSKDRVEIIGQYQEVNTYLPEEKLHQLEHFLQERPFILFTTQTFLHEYFADYISWLATDLKNKHRNERIVVKLHPLEKEEDYSRLKQYDNVLIFEENTEYLLSCCSYHISIYSTTLYDATKYKCKNYSLYLDFCYDYISEFMKQGVSVLLQPTENPLEKDAVVQKELRTDLFYDSFEEHKYKLLRES